MHALKKENEQRFVVRTPDISLMRALGIRSSYKGRTADA